MPKTTTRPAPTAARAPLVEALEGRALLSAAPVAVPHAAATPTTRTTVHASRRVSLIGQDVTATVTVTAPRKAGTPAGTVELLEDGNPLQTADGTPLTLTLDAKGKASYRFGAGDLALYGGKHTLSAQFTSTNGLPNSTSRATTVIVKGPRLKQTSDGLGYATVHPGKGKATAQTGQTASVLYTGFLRDTGQIFDYATAHFDNGFQFTLNSTPEQVIHGFDEGVTGMKPGETRVLLIPPSLGYGTNGSPPAIPGNATLVFLITLLSST